MENWSILVKDDDGHWYVIPKDKEEEWNDYLAATYKYWLAEDYDNDPPDDPEWAIEVGGSPSRVQFRDYRICS